MPVPVYLLFGSQLLQETGVRFCEGRLMPSAQIGDSAEFLSKMNFREIYHDGQLYQHNRAKIINSRNSEVLIKNRLPLDLLKHIVCRSSPERDTLLNLLGPVARERWMQRLRVDDGHRRLFHKDRGTFIKDVHLSGYGSRITFHLCTEELRGPFHLRIEWKGKSKNFTYEQQDFEAPETPLEVEFPDGVIEPEYEVTLRLNDDVAYVGKFGSKDSLLDPF